MGTKKSNVGKSHNIKSTELTLFDNTNELTSLTDILQKILPSRIKPQWKTYLALDGGSGFYKIGKAVDVGDRIISIKTTCPLIKLITTCNANIENKLHRFFLSKKVSGEWFSLNSDDVEYIKAEFKSSNSAKQKGFVS